MTSADFSVVVPFHAGADPEHLRTALASIAAQTLPPRAVVVVVDGPVDAAHEEALTVLPHAEVLRLPVNVGSGLARRRAVERCTTAWVALVDADDVSEPTRFERQLAVLEATGADVCTTAMTEFRSDGRVLGVRSVPLEHPAFAARMGIRNPINQPSTVFRRSAYERAGGYQHLPRLEDYDLWARMLATGARFTGIAEPLVRFRSDGMLARRTSREARGAERELQRRLRAYGLVSRRRALLNRGVRGLYLRLPAPALRLAYRVLFRRQPGQTELAAIHRAKVA